MKILISFGTRPEAIKMAPLINHLKNFSKYDLKVCFTGQHLDLVTPILTLFNIKPDYNFQAMNEANGPKELTSIVMRDITKVIEDFHPEMVLVHGDTTSSLASALAAFYMKVPVGHVEAGLRTESISSPWPEECNRRLISVISDIHFAPTQNAHKSLIKEGVCKNKIHITGNTVIDALYEANDILERDIKSIESFNKRYPIFNDERKVILVTAHRRENIGTGIDDICNALLELNQKLTDYQIVLPSHPNPQVRDHLLDKLDGINGINVLPPFNYIDFVIAMKKTNIILTDSGGIQEEAPSLDVPVLVLRDVTERPEAVLAGTAIVVGTDTKRIVKEVLDLALDNKKYQKVSSKKNPYGDGTASIKIENAIENWLDNK